MMISRVGKAKISGKLAPSFAEIKAEVEFLADGDAIAAVMEETIDPVAAANNLRTRIKIAIEQHRRGVISE